MKAIGMLAMVAVLVMASGCCSYQFTQRHNANVDTFHALRAQATHDGTGMELGVDVLHLKGWWAAASADPAGATVSAVGDALIAGLGVVGVNAAGKQMGLWGGQSDSKASSSSSGSSGEPTASGGGTAVHAEPGSVVVVNNNGSGTQANGNSGQ